MKKGDERNFFVEEANKEALKGVRRRDGGPFGCVIVSKGKVVSKAHNGVVKKNDCTAHAEMQAIRKACRKMKSYDLSGCELYTTTKPCPMCMGAILWARIKRVYYICSDLDANRFGFDDKKFYDYFAGKNKSLVKMEHLEDKDCIEVFKVWKKKGGELY